MRLLVATRHLGFAGGIETHLQALLPLLQARGLTLAVLHEHPAPPGAPGLLSELPGVTRLETTGRALAQILQDIDRFGPDWVYNHGLDEPRLESALTRRYRTLLFAHNYDGLCVSGTRCHAGASDVTPCHRTLGPACLALYLPKHCGGRNPWTLLRRFRTESRRRSNLPHYAAILVASDHVGTQLRLHGVDPGRIHRVPLFPPGISPTLDPPPPRPATGQVLYLGRVTRLKGLDHLALALAMARPSLPVPPRLVVAGDGPDRETWVAPARAAGIPVACVGWVGIPDRNRLLAESDLLAVPSLWPEPFGLVGLEAACLGVPSVAYATGGIPEWLIPGVTGELASALPPRPEDLAQALRRALGRSDHWHSLRLGAWKHSQTWTPERHLTRLLEILGFPP